MPEQLLKISEVAKLLGLSVSTIRDLCNAGKLRCVHPTGSSHRRIPQSALDQYFARLNATSQNAAEIEIVIPPAAAQFKPRQTPAVFQRLGAAKYFERKALN